MTDEAQDLDPVEIKQSAADAARELFSSPDQLRSMRLRLRVEALRWSQEAKQVEQGEKEQRGASVCGPAAGAASFVHDLGITDLDHGMPAVCVPAGVRVPARGDLPPPLPRVIRPGVGFCVSVAPKVTLETLTRPPELPEAPRACFLPPGHHLAEVERETEGHRQNKAARHRLAAREASRGLRDVGQDFDRDVEACAPQRTASERLDWPRFRRRVVVAPTELATIGRDQQERDEMKHAAARSLRWHRGREKGALERFDRVVECGKRKVRAKCNACGVMHEVPDRCGCGRLCFPCRMTERKQRTARLALAQTRVLKAAARSQLLRGRKRWGEKMLTLTLPHVNADEQGWFADSHGEGATVKLRIEKFYGAWRAFSLRLQKWARQTAKRLGLAAGRGVVWYRSFEWTPGADGMGHPHFHLWIFCPYLPLESVRDWWREALAGQQIIAPTVVVDIRAADRSWGDSVRAEVTKGTITTTRADGERVAEYINKFSIVDLMEPDENGHRGRVPASTLARLYEALDGRRMVATSPRLLNPRHVGCQECGAVGWTRTELIDPRRALARPCPSLQGEARSPP